MENKPFVKRKQYVISGKFQFKYAAILIVFMFLIAWLAGYTVYYTAFSLLGEKLANVYPQGRLVAIFKTTNLILLMRMSLLIPFVIITSVFLSHRIAGPVFRMERYLGEIALGDFSSVLKLRKRDEFKNLAEAINKMTQGLKKIAQENQEMIAKLAATLEELRIALEQPEKDVGKIKVLTKQAAEQAKYLEERSSKTHISGNI